MKTDALWKLKKEDNWKNIPTDRQTNVLGNIVLDVPNTIQMTRRYWIFFWIGGRSKTYMPFFQKGIKITYPTNSDVVDNKFPETAKEIVGSPV